jgi:hypothetical protein
MAAFNKIHEFGNHLLLGKHDFSAAGNIIKVFLSDDTPTAAGTLKYVADKTAPGATEFCEIAAGSGYIVGGQDVSNSIAELTAASTGKWEVACAASKAWTAAGASFGGGTAATFRFVGIYDTAPTAPVADPAIGWWSYGTAGVELNDGESFTVTFTNSRLLTINSRD